MSVARAMDVDRIERLRLVLDRLAEAVVENEQYAPVLETLEAEMRSTEARSRARQRAMARSSTA